MLDGEPFIAKLEQAVEAADADFVEANMAGLERLVSAYQDRIYE